MLYNESTGKPKVKADVFSLENLIAWLKTMPAAGVYCYDDSGNCLLAQYFKSVGKVPFLGNATATFANDPTIYKIPDGFQKTAWPKPHYFGAALARARKAVA